MAFRWKDILNIIIGKTVMPGWTDVINRNGISMIVRDMQLKDKSVKCIGVCSSYAVIYSGPYEKSMSFLDKPLHYIIVLNEQSLGEHLDTENMNEVLETYRRVSLLV